MGEVEVFLSRDFSADFFFFFGHLMWRGCQEEEGRWKCGEGNVDLICSFSFLLSLSHSFTMYARARMCVCVRPCPDFWQPQMPSVTHPGTKLNSAKVLPPGDCSARTKGLYLGPGYSVPVSKGK